MFDAVLVKVFDFAARRRRDTPALRQFADALRHGTHFIRRELAGVNTALLKIAVHFFVGVNVDEAEHKPRGVACQLVAKTFDLRENVGDGEFVGQDQRTVRISGSNRQTTRSFPTRSDNRLKVSTRSSSGGKRGSMRSAS